MGFEPEQDRKMEEVKERMLKYTIMKLKERSEPIMWPIGDLKYEVYDVIGRGGNAIVNVARCIENGRICAIKRVNLNGSGGIRCAIEEVHIMSQLLHPYLASYSTSFIFDTEMWIVLDYYHFGSLEDIMKRNSDSSSELFNERMIASLLKDVLRGLMYLHHGGFIHSDIKPGNILFREDGSAVLSDFGSARCIDDKKHGIVTTPLFRAPELVSAKFLTPKCDIWSIGMTAVNLSGETVTSLVGGSGRLLALYKDFAKFSDLFDWVTSSCLLLDPESRLTAWRQLNHRFFRRPMKKRNIVEIVSGVPQKCISWKREMRPYNEHPQVRRFKKGRGRQMRNPQPVQESPSCGWQLDTPRSTPKPNSPNTSIDNKCDSNGNEGNASTAIIGEEINPNRDGTNVGVNDEHDQEIGAKPEKNSCVSANGSG